MTPDANACDVAVIGAGIAGASAAWALAHDLDVVLVEREATAGYHATGRSASVLSETSGLFEVCALAAASRAFFESPPADFADVALLSPRGLWWIGREEDIAALDRFAAEAVRVAPTVRRESPADTLRRLPGFRAEAVAGGSVAEPDAMAIDTSALLDGFLRGVRCAGGRVLTAAEAVTAHRSSGGWEVTAGDQRILCRHVVNAAGAWADELAQRAGVAPVGLRPLRRTAALVPAQGVEQWPLVMDIASRFYAEPESGGLLISPAEETLSPPCDARPEEEDVAWALHQLDEATELGVQRVLRAWAGLRTFAPDRRPVIGQEPSAPGFWWLAGQGGAGIKTAPAMAALLTAQLTGTPAPELPFDPAVLGPQRFR